VVPGKRIVAGAVGLLAATALFGCAPNGTGTSYSAADKAVPVNAEASATPSVTPSATPSATPSSAPAAPAQPAGIKITTLIASTIPKMGKVVTDEKGWVLYRFDKDTANPPTSACVATCAQIWPPMLTEGAPTLQGVLASKVGTVQRADGGVQITLNGWPLYRYIGDLKPGQWKGQAVSRTWWVIAPDGTKNLTCVPTGTPTPVAPPAASPAAGDASAAAGGGYSY
jgi:predicted lipoprotein with Yx(FWY)xxD motif